jgi:hypothetical protein
MAAAGKTVSGAFLLLIAARSLLIVFLASRIMRALFQITPLRQIEP